jgi:hypothetical protein
MLYMNNVKEHMINEIRMSLNKISDAGNGGGYFIYL